MSTADEPMPAARGGGEADADGEWTEEIEGVWQQSGALRSRMEKVWEWPGTEWHQGWYVH